MHQCNFILLKFNICTLQILVSGIWVEQIMTLFYGGLVWSGKSLFYYDELLKVRFSVKTESSFYNCE